MKTGKPTEAETAEKIKPALQWAVPAELQIPPDPLRIRLDFHHQAIVMTEFQGDITNTRLVNAMDIAQALAGEITVATGLLPSLPVKFLSTV